MKKEAKNKLLDKAEKTLTYNQSQKCALIKKGMMEKDF